MAVAAMRQPGNSTDSSTSEPGSGPTVTIVLIVLLVVILIIVALILLTYLRSYFKRRRSPSTSSTHMRTSSRTRIVLHSSAQPPSAPSLLAPAIVRIQRHAVTAGLSLQELDSVAPVCTKESLATSNFQRTSSQQSRHLQYHRQSVSQSDHQDEPDENIQDNDSDATQDISCPICLEDMLPQSKVRRLPCQHTFHAECIEEWVTKANRCPVCNKHVIDPMQLQKSRTAALQGVAPPPLIVSDSASYHRYRRRRARGENGIFQLQDGSTADTPSPATGNSPISEPTTATTEPPPTVV